MRYPLFLFLILFQLRLTAQNNLQQPTSINADGAAPAVSAILDLQATDKGILVPRMTSAQRNAIASPVTGLLVFDLTTNAFWFFNGTDWVNLSAGKALADADNNTKIQVEESPDEDVIRFDIGGIEKIVLRKNTSGAARLDFIDIARSTFVGWDAGKNNIPIPGNSGVSNTFIGYSAGRQNTSGYLNTFIGNETGLSNTVGYHNTALGTYAFRNNLSGNENVAVGAFALDSNISGSSNTSLGDGASHANTIGYSNVSVGKNALYFNLYGPNLVAIGDSALFNNQGEPSDDNFGLFNTAVGSKTLFSNTTGKRNTAIGYVALYANTSGRNNTASGDKALYSNTTGSHNTANGSGALLANTTGSYNTANGSGALYANTTGSNNTAFGQSALAANYTGIDNTASGTTALLSNTTGSYNTAIGKNALYNSNGSSNTACGTDALYYNQTGFSNTAVGILAADNGSSNTLCTAIGSDSDVGTNANSYTNAIAIGYDANTTANNYARIGNTSVTSIGGQVGWSNYSDGRFKRNVQENVAGLDFIGRLRPVTYQLDIHALNDFIPTTNDSMEWAGKYDIERVRFSGFIAQEVEQAAQAVGYDFSGVDKPQNEYTPYALRYGEFVVPLVRAMQEQQQIIENGEARIKALETKNAALEVQLIKITTALQGAGISLDY
jgi:hypothetical protein